MVDGHVTFNATYMDRYSYKVRDNLGCWLMAMQNLVSINTEKIFVSVTYMGS